MVDNIERGEFRIPFDFAFAITYELSNNKFVDEVRKKNERGKLVFKTEECSIEKMEEKYKNILERDPNWRPGEKEPSIEPEKDVELR